MEDLLRRGLVGLSLSLSDSQVEKLLRYLELLNRWNSAYNLTAITDSQQMVYLHLLDSLAILPYLEGKRFIDVGTGAGIPGIPLAIARPDANFSLLDSNGKRVRFLFQVKTELALENVNEFKGRVESFTEEANFDGVISRAFTSLREMADKSRHLLSEQGVFYAMKGRYPEKELRDLQKPYNVLSCRQLHVPGIEGERHLVKIALSSFGDPF